jgi:hypothetical protein
MLDFLSQIRLRQTCSFLYNNLYIIDLYEIYLKYLRLLNNEIISQHKNLKKLSADYDCKIDQNGIIKPSRAGSLRSAHFVRINLRFIIN